MELKTFADAQEVLAATLPNYTRRPHQIALAEQIEQAMADGKAGLFNAGCGTGKSMAALIPLILSGKRAIIGTPTKALQNQYMGDLQFLEENLGVKVSWALLKGRSNYLCAQKISELENPTPAQQAALDLYDHSDEEQIFDREGLPAMSNAEWNGLAISTAECPGKKDCPFGNVCMTERAKEKAQAAQLVVTNLTYLMLDRRLEEQSAGAMALLGDFEHVVVDEAHQLFDKATDALSDSIGKSGLEFLARDIEAFLHDQRRDFSCGADIRAAAASLWSKLEDKFWRGNAPKKEDPVRLRTADVLAVGDQIMALIETLNAAAAAVRSVQLDEPRSRASILKGRLSRRAGDWAARLGAVLTDNKLIKWLEMESKGRKNIVLWSAPLSPASFLHRQLFDKAQTTMMSATLTTGSNPRTKWDYTRGEQLKLSAEDTVLFDAGTPFDFKTQAMLYVPAKGQPEPKGPTFGAWRAMAQTQTKMLVEASGGNALLLYTSRLAMDEAWDRLAGQFRDMGLRPIKQGEMPTPELIREFKQGSGVLFGLKTFFEGIDIQGDALSLVVIDKLPFAVPTDVLHSARAENLVERFGKGADFGRLAIPEMSLVLIQGFGRLIRHANDKGVVAIMDPRLMSAGYGRQILASLPPAPVTTNIREAMSFLRS